MDRKSWTCHLGTATFTDYDTSGLYGAYRHAVGGKAAISVPKAGPIGSSFKCIYPPEWEGNIAIGKSLNPEIYKGTLIEASYKGGKPFINVSNVQGWTVPVSSSTLHT